jgi:cyclopropane fatty-acyl-phospholipid synthase-like methyltransferase
MYDEQSVDKRKKDAHSMVDTFYDLVTDFYESGWGQSFHFAPRGRTETFRESIVRHEHYIAAKINLNKDDICLDAGCGIGGPLRNIAQFSSAKCTGITINAYQVERGMAIIRENGLSHLAEMREMNFLNMEGFKDETFTKAFAIEATCHAGDRRDVFGEVFRVLKPGALFATYEWVLTDKYDSKNPVHVKSKHQIEKGNALPELISDKEAEQAMKDVGFELLESVDVAAEATRNGQLPWYGTLEAKCSMESLPQSYFATLVTHALCWAMERSGLAPTGTVRTHEFLLEARDGLVVGGQTGIFTPMHLLVGRKPAKKAE